MRSWLLTGLLLVSGVVSAANDRLMAWEVETPGAKVWLLGSMHLARADIYPLRKELLEAFEQAEALVVEVDIGGEAQARIQARMLEMGTYPPGRSIRDELSAETWSLLETQIEQTGLPLFMMERFKPGLLVTTIATMQMMQLGLNPQYGIDQYFLNLARDRKPILELESVEQQLELLLGFPHSDLLVRQSLYQLHQLDELMEPLIDSWRRGDADGLARLVLEDELARHPEFRPLQERMFDQRNHAMTDRILSLQRQGGSYFVVVGAGHLVGKQGIVSLLRQRGQRPRQM